MRTKEVLKAVKAILRETPMIEAERLVDELVADGFNLGEIESAFALIYGLPEIIIPENEETGSLRVFSDTERYRFSLASQNFLWTLLNSGVVTQAEFEEIVINILSLDQFEIGVSEVHWGIQKVLADPGRMALLFGNFVEQYPN